MSQGTEEHRAPKSADPVVTREALIIAYPDHVALPLPSDGILGRDWLAIHRRTDTQISGSHAKLSRPGGVLHIEDASSRNGTWINGARLGRERVPLVDGAIVRLGGTLFVYRDALRGSDQPSPPIGDLVGPFGLRELDATFAAIRSRPTNNLMIEGETGTGKELLAAAAAAALRPKKPYGPVNVAGVPAGVFESQLFGYVAGAYSGAGKGARGVLLAHDQGTVFLDEIGELPLDLQPKLLRVLENREVLPVGADRPVRVDVLIIAATNRSLEDMVTAGRYRQDLLARFATGRLSLPSLRDRPEDIWAITTAIAARRGERFDPAQVEIEAVERLLLHAWTSNVRELAGVMEQVARLRPPPLFDLWAIERVLGSAPAPSSRGGQLVLADVRATLAACAGNQSEAARRLGVSRPQLLRFLSKHGMS